MFSFNGGGRPNKGLLANLATSWFGRSRGTILGRLQQMGRPPPSVRPARQRARGVVRRDRHFGADRGSLYFRNAAGTVSRAFPCHSPLRLSRFTTLRG